jgi:peptidoglycan/xylan/chitin deacetylase (PgdA/CDA1 family)
MPANSHYKFDFLSLGGREYGARHGIWRLLDVLEGHDVKATVLANGIMAELFPDSVRAAAERGHEIAAHQWDQAIFPTMFTSRDEECASLSKTKAVLERVAKHPVVRYMSPGPRSTPHTVEILAELDFSWACEYVDSDFPYLIPVGGKDIVAISYATPGCIDFDLLLRGLNDRLEELKITFAAAYKEADRHPRKFCYAVHTHWGGTVGMAWVLEEFLSYVRRHEGVWYPRHSEMADFWLQQTRANHR